jgi:broad specificity phosphatase PhoE
MGMRKHGRWRGVLAVQQRWVRGLYTSPYTRAVQTAAPIAESTGLNAGILDVAHERVLPSELNGHAWNAPEDKTIIEEIFQMWIRGNGERYADEETFDDLTARVKKLQQFILDHPAQHIAIVSHSTFMKTFLAHIFSVDIYAPKALLSMYHTHEVANAGICEFTHHPDHGWKLVSWNDRAHLLRI